MPTPLWFLLYSTIILYDTQSDSPIHEKLIFFCFVFVLQNIRKLLALIYSAVKIKLAVIVSLLEMAFCFVHTEEYRESTIP